MKKNIGFMAAAVCGMLLFTACNDDIDVQQSYEFSVSALPVQKRIKKGETAEIRCTLERSGHWEQAEYFMRYFQPDGKGTLETEDGTVLRPNDLYELNAENFRLYYTSQSEDQQAIDLYFLDNFGSMFTLSFTFNNDNSKDDDDL